MERNQNLHQLCYWRTSRKGLFVTTAEVSAKCRWNVSDMSVICWWSNDWLSTEYWLTIDRLLSETDYWPHINRYSTDTRLVLDRQMTRTLSILDWQSTNTQPIDWPICWPRVNQHISPPLIRHKIHFFQVAHLSYINFVWSGNPVIVYSRINPVLRRREERGRGDSYTVPTIIFPKSGFVKKDWVLKDNTPEFRLKVLKLNWNHLTLMLANQRSSSY